MLTWLSERVQVGWWIQRCSSIRRKVLWRTYRQGEVRLPRRLDEDAAKVLTLVHDGAGITTKGHSMPAITTCSFGRRNVVNPGSSSGFLTRH